MQVQGALLNKFSLSRWSSQHSKVNASFVETVKPPSFWSSCCSLGVMNLTRIHEDAGSIPGLAQWIKDPVVALSCDIGFGLGLDLAWLWLWCRLAATALI